MDRVDVLHGSPLFPTSSRLKKSVSTGVHRLKHPPFFYGFSGSGEGLEASAASTPEASNGKKPLKHAEGHEVSDLSCWVDLQDGPPDFHSSHEKGHWRRGNLFRPRFYEVSAVKV